MVLSKNILLLIALAPLFGAIVAGLFGRRIGRAGAHWVTILGVGTSCLLSIYVLYQLVWGGAKPFNENLYTWLQVGSLSAYVGFLVDNLTALMMVVVTFVSLMVHIYTIGYMRDDPGYQRFFSYIALFTFSMLMLVMANNFLQLFFGWEAVGLVSYLLIGFWFKRPSAIFANLKAFLVNRVGDFGFLLGIAAVLLVFGSLDYATVFGMAQDPALGVAAKTLEVVAGHPWSAMTVICILLFIGAMGKSAQVPLHVWLPDSMEGPTPISALIHAATMVTAGIFMVARMSPLYELSDTALNFVLIIGATTALFTGLIGIVQNDIKRVIAYSTLSQLGYMTVALGASAYSAAIFHLMTHAFFKALLFLGAGSVIIALHHEQDMRYMGGLRRYLPITFITAWLGTLALVGFPGFSGFFSKDIIIEAVAFSRLPGADYAQFAITAGVFVTALYSFRLLYLTFHGRNRHAEKPAVAHAAHDDHASDHADTHGDHAPHESPWVVTIPLILLAIPSVVIGWLTVKPILFGNFFDGVIFVKPEHDAVREIGRHMHSEGAFVLHGFTGLPFWLMLVGFALATFIYFFKPAIAASVQRAFKPLHTLLERKYGFDELYQFLFARGSLLLGRGLWRGGDVAVIDSAMVNGSAALVDRLSGIVRRLQSGFLYHYAFAMIIGLIAMLSVFLLWPRFQ